MTCETSRSRSSTGSRRSSTRRAASGHFPTPRASPWPPSRAAWQSSTWIRPWRYAVASHPLAGDATVGMGAAANASMPRSPCSSPLACPLLPPALTLVCPGEKAEVFAGERDGAAGRVASERRTMTCALWVAPGQPIRVQVPPRAEHGLSRERDRVPSGLRHIRDRRRRRVSSVAFVPR